MTLSNIEIREVTLFEQVYEVTLRVQNLTEQPLNVRGGTLTLELKGREFGTGVSSASVEIPAFADALVRMRLVGTLFGMLRLIRGLGDESSAPISYEVSGRLQVEGSYTGLSYHEQGSFGGGRALLGEGITE